MKSFRPYDKRVRIDEITSKNIRDIMKWNGATSEAEVIRNSVCATWLILDNQRRENSLDRKKVISNE